MKRHFKYENEVIACVNDIVKEKFSDEFELVFDSTEPFKTTFKSKTTNFECEVRFKDICDKTYVEFDTRLCCFRFNFDTLRECEVTDLMNIYYEACKSHQKFLTISLNSRGI